MNQCETCYWYDPFFDDYGFCDEREEYVAAGNKCSRWKERENEKNKGRHD